MSANQSATSTLKNVMGLSQKLLNTSTDLSRVNATLQETDELLRDSSMTSRSWSPVLLGTFAPCHVSWPRAHGCSQTAILNNKNVATSGFAFKKEEKGLGYCLGLVHVFYIYQNVRDLMIFVF